jgi:hypothetical protein
VWHLREPSWVCVAPRRGARAEDVEFWIDRRQWQRGFSKDGRRVYGQDLEEGKAYELVPRDLR